jgi:hypothetical protein
MGGALSSTGGSITREQLLKSTGQPRQTLNIMFKKMLEKLTPEDFLKLQRTQTCSTFVFMMADSIHQIFDDLRIRPAKDKDTGVVYFQKIDTLKASTPNSKELCLTIAYFFIRIFQIFGALAITITDDPGAPAVLGAAQYAPQAPIPPTVQTERRGVFGPTRRIPGSRGTYMVGGAADLKYFTSGKAKAFAPIHKLFDDVNTESIARNNRLILEFKNNPGVMIYPEGLDARHKDRNMKIILPNSAFLYATMTLETIREFSSTETKYIVILNNFFLVDASKESNIDTINRQLRDYTVRFDMKTIDGGETWFTKNMSFSEKLTKTIKRAVEIGDEINNNPSLTITNLSKTEQEGAQGLDSRRESRTNTRTTGRDVGVITALQNEYLLLTLKGAKGQKPVGFCVARALQLLDANSLIRFRGKAGTLSSVCTRFDALSQSIPRSGKTLDEMAGLKALDQLYHTKPMSKQDGTVRVDVPTDASSEYADFLNKMMSLFGRGGQTQLTGIEKIVVKDPNCGTTLINKILQLQDSKQIKKILDIVNQMFGRQLAHTQKVMIFLKTRLFSIKDGGRVIDINKTILQGGIDELEKVSKEARTILLDYYSGCETQYQKGMQLVLQATSIPIA